MRILLELGWRLDGWTFAACLMVLGAVWLGYPAVIALIARWHPFRPERIPDSAPASAWPFISVIIAAHNEAEHIAARIRNLWTQDYPSGRVEILVSEDGSEDGTAAIVSQLAEEGRQVPRRYPVRLLSGQTRSGKAAAINRAVAQARGEVLVLCDANAEFSPQALRALVAPFGDASVGAVTGRKRVRASLGVGGGESVYWRYEATLTRQESLSGSTVAAFGEALALRREQFRPLPTEAMLNDDLYLGLQVLAQGKRLLSAPEAESWENGAADSRAEWERRRRMAVGRWAALAGLQRQWKQFGAGNLCRIAAHEVLRGLSGVFLGLAVITGTALLAAPAGMTHPLLVGAAWLQTLMILGAGLVGVARGLGWKLGRAEAPYFFLLALAAASAGAWRYFRGGESAVWRRAARASQAPASAPVAAGAAPRQPMDTPRILGGLFWASSSFLAGKVLVFFSIIILARILAPSAFGDVALATTTIMVLEILGTMGLTSALIYQEHDLDLAAGVCFWMLTLATAVEIAAGWWLAPWVAGFFHDHQLTAMLHVMALALAATTLGNTHDALLRRRLAFRAKLLPDLAAAGAKGIASVALALLGFGAWSLIWGQVLGAAASTLLLWQVMAWRPRWPWRGGWHPAVARRLFAYAKHIYVLDSSSVVLSHLDAFTIGRMLSNAWLGFYTLAYRIPEVMLLSVLALVARVVFPALSRLQQERESLEEKLLLSARYTTLVTLPIAAGMAILARPLVIGFYGWRWEPAIPVLQVLALYGAIRCVTHTFGDGYKAIGRPDVLTRISIGWWLLLPPSLILGARWGGIIGVAWGQVFTRVVMSLVHLYLITRILHISLRRLWRSFAPAIEATAVMALSLLPLANAVSAWTPRSQLAVMTLVGMVIYFAYLGVRHPRVLQAAWTHALAGAAGARASMAPRRAAAQSERPLADAEAVALGKQEAA